MKVDAAQKQVDQIAFFCSSPSSIEFRKKIETSYICQNLVVERDYHRYVNVYTM